MGGIGHSSWVLAQRPSMSVMLSPYAEPVTGSASPSPSVRPASTFHGRRRDRALITRSSWVRVRSVRKCPLL